MSNRVCISRVCIRCGEAWSFDAEDAKCMNSMCPECTARNLRPDSGPWVDLGPEIVTHDKPAMMQVDPQGRLLCKCPACEREHTMQGVGWYMSEALDLIERLQWEGQDYTQESCCIACGEEKNYGVHAKDCETALLLRKHGRKVRFQGEP